MRPLATALTVFALSGCASTPATTPNPVATPTFDLAAVQASFTEECRDPIIVDEVVCDQVEIGRMTADGTILNVPTTLKAAADDRAEVICDQVARAHFDGNGADLGFEIVGILDRDGGHAAACSVP